MKNILILFFSFTLCTVYCTVHAECVWAGVVYYHSDHLGSSSVLTDELGNISGESQYYPYGTVFLDAGVHVTPYTFTGQEEDEETSLYYYGARYYDPQIARFISVDPANDSSDPYTYVGNNPLRFIDPTGETLEPAIPNEVAEYLRFNDIDAIQFGG